MFDRIVIETTRGTIKPKPIEDLAVEDVMAMNRFPSNLFQAYEVITSGKLRPIPMDTRISTLEKADGVLVRCTMNPDFSTIVPPRTERHHTDGAVTTIREIRQHDDGSAEEITHEISPTMAQEIVATKVTNFIHANSKEQIVLAGISGGGDSNSLVRSLRLALDAQGGGRRVVAYTLVLHPLWPESAANRAAQLCKDMGVEHLIIDGPRMTKILDMKTDMSDFYYRFLHRFEPDTSHFFGTFIISAIARRLCAQYGTKEYCLGFNREDLLAELLFSLMNGRKPLQFPVRPFGEVRLLMPAWELPKKILDACYPDYSRENYEERTDRTTRQRGLIRYLSHAVDDIYTNLGLSLMTGVQKLFADGWAQLEHYRPLDLYIEAMTPPDVVNEVKSFMEEHFRARD